MTMGRLGELQGHKIVQDALDDVAAMLRPPGQEQGSFVTIEQADRFLHVFDTTALFSVSTNRMQIHVVPPGLGNAHTDSQHNVIRAITVLEHTGFRGLNVFGQFVFNGATHPFIARVKYDANQWIFLHPRITTKGNMQQGNGFQFVGVEHQSVGLQDSLTTTTMLVDIASENPDACFELMERNSSLLPVTCVRGQPPMPRQSIPGNQRENLNARQKAVIDQLARQLIRSEQPQAAASTSSVRSPPFLRSNLGGVLGLSVVGPLSAGLVDVANQGVVRLGAAMDVLTSLSQGLSLDTESKGGEVAVEGTSSPGENSPILDSLLHSSGLADTVGMQGSSSDTVDGGGPTSRARC